MKKRNFDQLCGKTTSHLADAGDYAKVLHKDVIAPFEALKAEASEMGFDLQIASGFRSFARQLSIWNSKALGERAVLNNECQKIDISCLSELELIHAIMRWSALPGASRHHWGTDFDVYDAAAVSEDYRLQLTPEETQGDGPFAPLHKWLDNILPSSDFYRPYQRDHNGVAPEPWHLSYKPVADEYAQQLSPAAILSALKQGELLVGERVAVALHDCIAANIQSIYQRFVQVA